MTVSKDAASIILTECRFAEEERIWLRLHRPKNWSLLQFHHHNSPRCQPLLPAQFLALAPKYQPWHPSEAHRLIARWEYLCRYRQPAERLPCWRQTPCQLES